MSNYNVLSSSTLPSKFAATCAAAFGFAVIGLFTPSVPQPGAGTPHDSGIVTLPTIVVVPDAADRAAAAALSNVVAAASGNSADGA